ncbi:MAG: hypothetical protein K6E78_01860 [Treponema sp.]|nr:hypothetical protein [Treponema sp.]
MVLAILLHESDALKVLDLQKKIEECSRGSLVSYFPLFINLSLPVTKISQAKNIFSGLKILSPEVDEKGIFLPVKISLKSKEAKKSEESRAEIDSCIRILARVTGSIGECVLAEESSVKGKTRALAPGEVVAEKGKLAEEKTRDLALGQVVSEKGKLAAEKPCRKNPFKEDFPAFKDFSLSLKRFQLAECAQSGYRVDFSDKIWIAL